MFMGEFNLKVDAKGRVMIPAKLREQLGDKFVLSKGFDDCLAAYPMDQWTAFEEKLTTLPITNKQLRKFVRCYVAGATICEPDGQGRILIPQTLREYADLDKEVVFAGVINRVEIWSKEKWAEESDDDDMDAIAEEIQKMGFII